jgi:FAD/FMN-containing dehydrogenase
LSLELTQRGYVLPASTHPGLGISGLTLGGGLGFASRALGLTSDKVLAALVVTSEGELLTASKTNHTDLFFALRGGGGNYGIVTSWGFELSEVPTGQVTWLRYGWQYTTEAHLFGVLSSVLAAWNAWQPWDLPKEFAMVELLIGKCTVV